ncbi:hypothetical protein Ntsu_79710 [Nocardia sp. IFM 10818]
MPNTYLRDVARRRAARSGIPYQRALQQLTRFDPSRSGAPRNPAGIDWTPLIGVEVTLRADPHTLRAVVLPPDGVRPGGDLLRIAVTSPHTGIAPAAVTYIDARWWTIDPMPDLVDHRYRPSRRQVRSGSGLPIHRSDTLPAAALATKSMLATRYRMRPADGQRPVALYYALRDYFPLYVIDDAEPMAALSPSRQAAWEAVRTCARCGDRGLEPYPVAGDGGRYCPPCDGSAADEAWTRGLELAQRAATEWAGGVVTDPNAVIVACQREWAFTRLVALETVYGQVVHDLITPTDVDEERASEQVPHNYTPWPEVAQALAALKHRRIISENSWRLVHLARAMAEAGTLEPALLGTGEDWASRTGDGLARWYGYWLSQPEYTPAADGARWGRWWQGTITLRGRQRSTEPVPAGAAYDPVARCRSDLGLLREMAAGLPSRERTAGAQGGRSLDPVHVYHRDLRELAARTAI